VSDESTVASPAVVGWRRLCGVAAFGVAGCLLLGSLGRFHWAAELFVHYQAQYLVALLMLVAAFAVLKSRRGVLLCLVLLIFPVIRMAPLYRGAHSEGEVPAFRVVTFNVLASNTRHDEVASWLEEVNGDVVFLCEADGDWQSSLQGLETIYPHVLKQGHRGNLGYMLLSKHPIDEARQFFGPGFQPLVVAKLSTGHGQVTVIGAHPVPPVSASYAKRNRSYLRLLRHHAVESDGPTLVIGDLNASRWALGLQPLFDDGFRDTAEGFGYQATWMRRTGLLAIPIDHVLTRELPAPTSREIGMSMGSDHSPVVVDFPAWDGND